MFTVRGFEVVSWADAEAMPDPEEWVIPGVMATGANLVYGTTEAGKTSLVAALLASLTTGRDFLGFGAAQRKYRPFVGWTDDNGRHEYKKRMGHNLAPGDAPAIHFTTLSEMGSLPRWNELYEAFTEAGSDLLVLDNLTDFVPPPGISDDNVARGVYQGVRLFTRSGVPVILVGHSSTARNEFGQLPTRPMGSSVWTNSARWRWHISRSSDANVKIDFAGNLAPKHTVSLHQGVGARFTVTEKADASPNRQERRTETYELHTQAAAFVVDHCQGMNGSETAQALQTQFASECQHTKETWRQQLTRRGLSKLVVRKGDRWERKVAA